MNLAEDHTLSKCSRYGNRLRFILTQIPEMPECIKKSVTCDAKELDHSSKLKTIHRIAFWRSHTDLRILASAHHRRFN